MLDICMKMSVCMIVLLKTPNPIKTGTILYYQAYKALSRKTLFYRYVCQRYRLAQIIDPKNKTVTFDVKTHIRIQMLHRKKIYICKKATKKIYVFAASNRYRCTCRKVTQNENLKEAQVWDTLHKKYHECV